LKKLGKLKTYSDMVKEGMAKKIIRKKRKKGRNPVQGVTLITK